MLEENTLLRPTSGNPIQLRPKTGRPKTSFKNDGDNVLTLNEDKIETKVITESLDENKNENNYNNIKEQLLEKTQFLEALGNDKKSFDNMLSKEIKRIKNINEKKTILKDINLIEKNYDDLYEWTNLFNNSRPISSYTTLKKPKLNISEDKKIQEFKSPVVLVDLFEDQMNLYFGKNNFINTESKDSKNKIKNKLLKNNIKKNANKKNPKKLSINMATNNVYAKSKSNNKGRKESKIININNTQNYNNLNPKKENYNYIRPMSVYSPRVNCSFYFSSAFSDYYKEDLKTFSEKMKILKAKVKSNPYKLNHEIKTQRHISSKKEVKLNRILNMQTFNFGKDNLIIAADRKNPLPLLKNIFKQTYPNKELMKEHLKMYFNTMKPLGEYEGPIDYTKNERWRLSEQIAEMREGNKHLKFKYNKNIINYDSFNSKQNKKNNLILSYYNDKDPYIQMFEKMIKKNNNNNNNANSFQEIDKNENNQKYFNPILQNFNNTFSSSFNKKLNEENKEKKENIENKENKENNQQIKNKNNLSSEENIIKNDIPKNNINNNNRPKTGNKLVGSNIANNFIKRPLTSTIKQYNILYANINQEKRNSFPENYIDPNSNFDYISSNCFPLKTISNVGNASYDKINQMIQERQQLKNDYFLTSTGQIKSISNTPKYKEDKIIFEKNNNIRHKTLSENNKWNDSFNKYKYNKKNKLNYYNFNNVMDNLKKNKKSGHFYTLKYFKNMGGKYYSSSNNVNVKNKRNNKIKLLNNFYTESKYSRDDQDQDLDFIDEAVSSQTNSSYRKI